MTQELQNQIIYAMLLEHPLPWKIEQNEMLEVVDVNHFVVLKVPSRGAAIELVGMANRLHQELYGTMPEVTETSKIQH